MKLIIIVGGAGSGKTRLVKDLKNAGCSEIISHTTRKPRDGEKHGEDYYFVDNFENMKFVEYVNHGEYQYGISVDEFMKNINNKNLDSICVIVEPYGILQILKWILHKRSSFLIGEVLNIKIVHLYIKREYRFQRLLEEYSKTTSMIYALDKANRRIERNNDNIDELFTSFDYLKRLYGLMEDMVIYNHTNLVVHTVNPTADFLEECNHLVECDLYRIFGKEVISELRLSEQTKDFSEEVTFIFDMETGFRERSTGHGLFVWNTAIKQLNNFIFFILNKYNFIKINFIVNITSYTKDNFKTVEFNNLKRKVLVHESINKNFTYVLDTSFKNENEIKNTLKDKLKGRVDHKLIYISSNSNDNIEVNNNNDSYWLDLANTLLGFNNNKIYDIFNKRENK